MQAGHALAAASEGVGVQHVGAFTLLLLPGAYVALDSGALAALGPWRTLRVSPLLGFFRYRISLCSGPEAWSYKGLAAHS